VVDELAGLRARRRPAGAVDDVVQALLEQAQEVLAGRTLEADGFLVRAAELALEDAVDVLRLLLLLELGQVLRAAVAATGAAVSSGRVRRPFSFSKMFVLSRRDSLTLGPV